MNLNRRHILLLKKLMSSSEPLSSEILAISMGTVSKTVRNDLEVVDELLQSMAGARLVLKSGKGIYIEVLKPVEYEMFYESFHSKYQGNILFSLKYSEDILYLTRRILLQREKYITIDTLAGELYRSNTTISANISEVKELLRNYHLELVNKSGCGFSVKGYESHIRIAMADLVRDGEEIYMSFSRKKDWPMMVRTVVGCITAHHISLSRGTIYKFAFMILICEERDQQKVELEERYRYIEGIDATEEYKCVVDVMSALGDVDGRKDVLNYLAVFLISRRDLSSQDSLDIRKERMLYELSGELIDWIFAATEMDFTLFQEFRLNLARHLRGMYYRVKYGMEKRDVKIIETKQNESSLEYAMIVVEYLLKKWKISIQEYEITFLAGLFYPPLIYMKKSQKLRILIVTIDGLISGRMMASELLKYWDKFVDSIVIKENYMLDTIELEHYDLLVSDIPNIQVNARIPTAYMNGYINEQDFLRLQTVFETNNGSYAFFANSFQQKFCFHNIEVGDKTALIKMIAEKAVPFFPDEDMYDSINRREMLSPTEQENSVVILHSYTSMVREALIMIFSVRKPIAWNLGKCRLAFFVINGKNEVTPFSNLAIMKSAVSDMRFAYDMIKSESYAEMMATINEWIKRRTSGS